MGNWTKTRVWEDERWGRGRGRIKEETKGKGRGEGEGTLRSLQLIDPPVFVANRETGYASTELLSELRFGISTASMQTKILSNSFVARYKQTVLLLCGAINTALPFCILQNRPYTTRCTQNVQYLLKTSNNFLGRGTAPFQTPLRTPPHPIATSRGPTAHNVLLFNLIWRLDLEKKRENEKRN